MSREISLIFAYDVLTNIEFETQPEAHRRLRPQVFIQFHSVCRLCVSLNIGLVSQSYISPFMGMLNANLVHRWGRLI